MERRVRGRSQQPTTRTARVTTVHNRHDKTLSSSDSVSRHNHRSHSQRIPVRQHDLLRNDYNDEYPENGNSSRHNLHTPNVSSRNLNASSPRYNGDIYVPPVIQDGWRGRDDVTDYRPYSPSYGDGQRPIGQVRQWPVKDEMNDDSSQRITTLTSSNNAAGASATATTTARIDNQRRRGGAGNTAENLIRLENVMERIEPRNRQQTRGGVRSAMIPPATPARKEKRIKTNKYSLSTSSEKDERYHHSGYRGMEDDHDINDYYTTHDDDDATSFSRSRATSFFSSSGSASTDEDEYTTSAASPYSMTTADQTTDDQSQQQHQHEHNMSLTSSKSTSQKKHRDRLPVLSKSESESTIESQRHRGLTHPPKNPFLEDGGLVNGDPTRDDPLVKTRQELAYFTILLTSVQLLILMLQWTMCGFARPDANPMLGPFPDQFSSWGGKNLYLMLYKDQWWRLVSPALLHVGVLHLAANVFCQLHVTALFEREWGSIPFAFIYIMSELGCSVTSNYCDPDTIAVGSSGALMGIFGAKSAQVVTLSLFEVQSMVDVDDVIRFDQLTSVLFGLTLTSMLGALTYVDWSGNMGGLAVGFFAGIFVFGGSIYRCCGRFFWSLLGLAAAIGPMGYVLYLIIESSTPDEQLADVCEYYRSFFTEDYECGCPWK